ncbi:6-phosphogluconolactonase [Buchnera aphidicola (Eriosoma lanigerum)]|uniref:beta-propeller fold lactonase family protein n=1 Tax=Buchnera aphidicola TaxID=9 RepID=UPI003464E6A8
MYQNIYIASPESNQIEVWNLNNNGIANLIQIVKIHGKIQPLCILKEKNILYAGLRSNNCIITYKISKTGILKTICNFSIPYSINYISIDINRQKMICSSYHSGSIIIISLNALGYPIKIDQQINYLAGCHCSIMDLDQKILFTSALKQNKIHLFIFYDKTIVSNPNQKYVHTEYNSGPRHIIFHPNNINLYSINELNGTINTWIINYNSNTIKNLQNINLMPISFKGTPWASEIRILPNGQYLYASDRTTSIISIFKINIKNGILSRIAQIQTELQPRSFDIDEFGKYLVIAGQKSNFISIYQINQVTGLLKFIARYPVGNGPLWVLINNNTKINAT